MWPFSSPSSSSLSSSSSSKQDDSVSACPVDHDTRQKWLEENRGSTPPHPPSSSPGLPRNLSEDRVVSSIPRHFEAARAMQEAHAVPESSKKQTEPIASSSQPSPQPPQSTADSNNKDEPSSASARSHWVYPSPSQFHAALVRKGHTSAASGADMDVVVPIHNAVNERCWEEILQWERSESAKGAASWMTCGGPKLVSFKGKPTEKTWKAWFKGLLGYQAPFDRHDWLVDRCGHRMRYIIDFYAGRSAAGVVTNHPFLPGSKTPAPGSAPQKMSFYLDVRPAPDSLEGIGMRIKRTLRESAELLGFGTDANAQASTPAKPSSTAS